jgi:hypothetical protein
MESQTDLGGGLDLRLQEAFGRDGEDIVMVGARGTT